MGENSSLAARTATIIAAGAVLLTFSCSQLSAQQGVEVTYLGNEGFLLQAGEPCTSDEECADAICAEDADGDLVCV